MIMKSDLKIIDRKYELFSKDIHNLSKEISDKIRTSKFLVIGAGGSIGQAVTLEIFKRNPKVLHAIDISENNTVELVRNIRSSLGYIDGEFKTFIIDVGSREYEAFMIANADYDYILNLSALKHVRSERDPFTLMRMIEVNILNTIRSIKLAPRYMKKYFVVSTDKATNPVNMMGASKKIMELFLTKESKKVNISSARFANVAFSDGSLLSGLNHRFMKKQPISAPNDVKRFFLTSKEAGELCLLSCLFADNRQIFFPKESEDLKLTSFPKIVENFLNSRGYEVAECDSENQARDMKEDLIKQKKWPCYFFQSDTTGEKSFEEFYTNEDNIILNKYSGVGIIENNLEYDDKKLIQFIKNFNMIKESSTRSKTDLIKLFNYILPDFSHIEKNKNLDEKM